MTREAYQLAKLQPGGIDYAAEPGGEPELTAADVCAALGMGSLKREAELLLRLKYAGDKTGLHALDAMIREHVEQMAIAHGWRFPWPKEPRKSRIFFLQLGRLALNEVLGESRCTTCSGRGKTLSYHQCKRCQGSGRSHSRPAECGRWCGIDARAWQRTWAARYESDILPLVQGWERVGLAHIKRHLC